MNSDKQLKLGLVKIIDEDNYLIVFGAINSIDTCYSFSIVNANLFCKFLNISVEIEDNQELPKYFDPNKKYSFKNNILNDYRQDINNWCIKKGMPVPN